MAIKKTGVTSTCLRNVGHDKESKTLQVEFKKSGAVYQYSAVSTRTANGLKNASSVGKYFNRNVRNEYSYRRIRGGRGRGRVKRHK
jgi:KTSC domain